MNYHECTNWMFNKLPMYQTHGAIAYKKDLTNTLLLSDYLGNPERKIKCIHVAGTNGKGSTSHFLASVFQEAGYRVGLYTSPHLVDFRERIRINGEKITEDFVCDFINKHKPFFEKNNLSFFEMTVGLAFNYFVNQSIDIAIIEVGMGGRLDSTNIISPLVSVITNIGLDHTTFLGTTLTEISREKAGIIKPKTPVVIGEYSDETKPVFISKAKENNAEIYFASDLIQLTYPSDLVGNYQEQNKRTVLQTIHVINSQKQFYISESNIVKGFLSVSKNTGLKGRWQKLQSNPTVICDTAHNQHGLEIVLKQLEKEIHDQLHLVIGFVNDKDLEKLLPLFPKKAHYYFCSPNNSRGISSSVLAEKANQFGLKGSIFNSVSEAYQKALITATKKDVLFVGGSTFVVAEIV